MSKTAEMVRFREVALFAPGPLCFTTSVVAILAAGAAHPVVWATLTTLAIAILTAPSFGKVWEAIPLAVVYVASALAGSLLVAGLVGLPVLSHALATKGLLILVNVLVCLIAVRSGGRRRSQFATWDRRALFVMAPFMLMCLLATMMAMRGAGRWTGWFLGGDNLRHIGFVSRVWHDGALDPATSNYPRAWHSIVAALWTSTGPSRDQQGLSSLIATQAILTWLMAAVLALALAVVAWRIARAFGTSDGLAGLAAFLASVAFLGPQFLGDYIVRGFETSLLVTMVLVVMIGEVLVAPERRRTLVVSALGVALVAHTWQIMLPAAVVMCGVTVYGRWRARPSRHSLLVDAVLIVIPFALALTGVVNLVSSGAAANIANAGDVPKPAWLWFIAVVACCLWAIVRHRRKIIPLALAIATVVATALGASWGSGVSLESYYPNKTVWTAVVLGLPLLGVAVAEALKHLDQLKGPLRGTTLIAGAAVGLGCLVSLAAPVAGVTGAWSTADGDVVVSAATHESAPRVSVVWGVAGFINDATTQALLDFYSATVSSPGVPLAPRSLSAQCDLLVQEVSPVVMSAASEAEVRARFACAPNLDLVSVGRPR